MTKEEQMLAKLIPIAEKDCRVLWDCFELCKNLERIDALEVLGKGDVRLVSQFDKENYAKAHNYSKQIRKLATNGLQRGFDDMYELYEKTLLFDAQGNFDCYCRYLEWNRDKEKKFYEPRRKQLLPVAKALQRLEDDELDLLAISEPPGIGKTTIAIFYLTWIAGKHPDLQILGGSHNNSFLRGVYDECVRIILGNGGDYLWGNVFPTVKLVSTNAKDLRADLGRRKRFETLEFSSIGSGNAGKVRATSLLYCDDLVDSIETAMSIDRLDKLWQQYYTDLRQRKIGDKTKELHIATRWSVHDVIGRLEQQYEGNPRAEFIRFAALNENDESNFDYPYGLGYTTEQLHEQRDIMDDASWKALYMNEPIEREGLLYESDELRRYFDLPTEEPDAILSVCDIADGGGDFWCLPVAYQYGQDFYIDAVIFDNGKPDAVEQRIVNELIDRKVQTACFESNRAGGRVAENVRNALKERNGITHITTKWNQTNKETRIIVASGFAKEHFLFKDESVYPNKEYRRFIEALTSYTMMGKNKHDDAPDAMASLVDYVGSYKSNRITVVKRPF